jgi:8-oxo-dGTP pyrophosphatase MutT (NUDIX family)
MWVFPGGRIEEDDAHPDAPEDELAAAQRAAVREAEEECALVIDPARTVPFSHWTPPSVTPRRYATWFFLAPVPPGEVLVDGGEMIDHRWLTPREVLAQRDAGEIDLAPPTWMTLHDLLEPASVDDALALAARRDPIPRYETRWANVEGGAAALWVGDVGYDTWDVDPPGPRHRLWMLETGWRLERDAF